MMENFIDWAHLFLLLCCCSTVASSDHNVEVFNIVPEILTENSRSIYSIFVDLTSSRHECETKFLSVTIDSYSVDIKWTEYDFQSPKLQHLAAALSPCDIRLGGTYSDFLNFDPNGAESFEDKQAQEVPVNGYMFDSGLFESTVQLKNFTMTGKHWDKLNTFLEKVNWDLMFDLNLFKWKDGLWDPSNAELLLNYSAKRGIKISNFQLGNEPNFYYNFNLTVSPEMLTEDFRILKNLISKYPLYSKSGLYGPDVTNLKICHGSVEYLSEFISSGAYDVVTGISLHHYYLNARTATEDQFLDISVLNSLKNELQMAVDLLLLSPRPLPILLTETSSCYGGGAFGLSDTYMAGFLWLDKLGLSAQYGISRVFRQTFLGAAYGLLTDRMTPNPDYYLSVLFKRLIEGPVFSASVEPPNEHLRVYAHCARRYVYQAGALVIYYMNLQDRKVHLDLPQFQNADLDLYLFTPGDEAGLKSRHVRLNGVLLHMSRSTLPPLTPQPHRGNVIVSPTSFGFIVVPNFNATLCLKYFANSAGAE